MSWISVDDALPENNTLCWAYIPYKGIILRLFSGDGFGLGDLDYEVSYWMKFNKPILPDCIVLPENRSRGEKEWNCLIADYPSLRNLFI